MTESDLEPQADIVPETELAHRRRVQELACDTADLFVDIGERILELRRMDVPTADWLDITVRQFSDRVQTDLGPSGVRILAGFVDIIAGYLEGGQVAFDDKTAKIALDAGGALADMMPAGGVMGLLSSLLPAFMEIFQKPSMPARLPTPEENAEWVKTAFTPETQRIKGVIERLFAEAPKMTDASGKEVDGQTPAFECHVILKSGGALQGSLSTTPEGTLRLLAVNQIKGPGGEAKPILIEHFFDYDQVADVAVMREMKVTAPTQAETSRIITS